MVVEARLEDCRVGIGHERAAEPIGQELVDGGRQGSRLLHPVPQAAAGHLLTRSEEHPPVGPVLFPLDHIEREETTDQGTVFVDRAPVGRALIEWAAAPLPVKARGGAVPVQPEPDLTARALFVRAQVDQAPLAALAFGAEGKSLGELSESGEAKQGTDERVRQGRIAAHGTSG